MADFAVNRFGAVGDGRTLNTDAIQKALDAAHAAGGGRVVVPPGTWLTGTLLVRDHVTLEVQSGATLLGSTDIAHYPHRRDGHNADRQPHHLLVLAGRGITLCGGGTIDGSGPAFWDPPVGQPPWKRARRPRVSPMVECIDCADLRIGNLTLANSAGWTCHLFRCDCVVVHGLRIVNDVFGPNTDGIDINGCRDVLVSDCHIETGDDAIVLKSTADARSCERIVVTNCIIRSNCAALKLGTESHHDMRQIAFSNCVCYASNRAVGLYCLDGATYEDVLVGNIVADTECGIALCRPIHLDLRRRTDESRMGVIRNVRISNFACRTAGRILLTAEKGGLLQNILLRDVQLTYRQVEDPVPLVPQAKSTQFSNRSPEARAARAAVVAENVQGLELRDLVINWPAHSEVPMHALWGRNLQGGVIASPLARPSASGVPALDLAGSSISHTGG